MNFLNDLAKDYQYFFSAIGAVGTMLAVIVSLYLARDKSGAKIESLVCKAKLSEGLIVLDGIGNLYQGIKSEEFVAVRIYNKGFFPVIIPFQFQFLSIPFSKYDKKNCTVI